jgi:hypothetical protein
LFQAGKTVNANVISSTNAIITKTRWIIATLFIVANITAPSTTAFTVSPNLIQYLATTATATTTTSGIADPAKTTN